MGTREAIDIGTAAGDLGIDDIRRMHEVLMREDRATGRHAGTFRTEQNWIGGRNDSPRDAAYIPPPPERVEPLMRDLVAFVNRDDVPAVAQAAIVHAQFETIHPFADGNGRVGRCLIHLVLRRRGLAPHYVPPVSVVLAANYSEYELGPTTFRNKHVEEWCATFARAVTIACHGAIELAERIEQLKARWREQAGSPRAHSAAAKLIDLLPVQ